MAKMPKDLNPVLLPINEAQKLAEKLFPKKDILFLTGPAGTGKTYLTRLALERNPNLGVLAASTGIAAVNLGGAVTINSLLKFYNEESIQTSF